MSGDWLHCNVCVHLPNPNNSLAYFFTSCGHIICRKCLEKGTPNTCRVCAKPAHITEINRSLKQEYQKYFRNPKDLLETYVKDLNSVLDFQSTHRCRLSRARQEQQKKAAKFVMSAQLEVKRKVEGEKKAIAEKDVLAEEVKKLRQHCENLETMLANARESAARSRASTPSRGSSGGSNREQAMQFSFMATSTPISDCPSTTGGSIKSASSKRLADMFTNGASEPSPIIGENMLTTPDMLGLNKNGFTKSGSRSRKNGEVFSTGPFGFQ